MVSPITPVRGPFSLKQQYFNRQENSMEQADPGQHGSLWNLAKLVIGNESVNFLGLNKKNTCVT